MNRLQLSSDLVVCVLHDASFLLLNGRELILFKQPDEVESQPTLTLRSVYSNFYF